MNNVKKYFNKLFKKQTETTRGTLSTKNQEQNNGTTSQQMPHPPGYQTPDSLVLHQSCKTVTYETYMRIMAGASKELLIIWNDRAQLKPIVDELELARAWDSILEEYNDLIRSEKSNTIFEAWKQFAYTDWKIMYVEHALPYLKRQWDKEIAERLTTLGFDYLEPETDDREDYMRRVYAIETEAKILVVQLNQFYKAYHSLLPQGEGAAIRKEIDYETELAILSKDAGYRIDKKTLTMFEHAAIVNAFLETNKVKKHGTATV